MRLAATPARPRSVGARVGEAKREQRRRGLVVTWMVKDVCCLFRDRHRSHLLEPATPEPRTSRRAGTLVRDPRRGMRRP